MRGLIIAICLLAVAFVGYFTYSGGFGEGAEQAAATAGDTVEGSTESAANAVDSAAETATDTAATALESTTETATDLASDAGSLVSVDGFDFAAVTELLDGSSLDETMKSTLKAGLEQAQNDPAALEGVLTEVRTALGL